MLESTRINSPRHDHYRHRKRQQQLYQQFQQEQKRKQNQRLQSKRKLREIPIVGPGLKGDYFETKDEQVLIQKLNALQQNQASMIIPPLLPHYRSESESSLKEAVEDPEQFLLYTLGEYSSPKGQQQQLNGNDVNTSHIATTTSWKKYDATNSDLNPSLQSSHPVLFDKNHPQKFSFSTSSPSKQNTCKRKSTPDSSSSPHSICKFTDDTNTTLDIDISFPYKASAIATTVSTPAPDTAIINDNNANHLNSATETLSTSEPKVKGSTDNSPSTTHTSKTVKKTNVKEKVDTRHQDDDQQLSQKHPKIQQQQLGHEEQQERQQQNQKDHHNKDERDEVSCTSGITSNHSYASSTSLQSKFQQLLKKKGNAVAQQQKQQLDKLKLLQQTNHLNKQQLDGYDHDQQQQQQQQQQHLPTPPGLGSLNNNNNELKQLSSALETIIEPKEEQQKQLQQKRKDQQPSPIQNILKSKQQVETASDHGQLKQPQSSIENTLQPKEEHQIKQTQPQPQPKQQQEELQRPPLPKEKGEFQTIRFIRRSSSFSSSIHDLEEESDKEGHDEKDGDSDRPQHYIEINLPQHHTFQFKRSSSFSSSIDDHKENISVLMDGDDENHHDVEKINPGLNIDVDDDINDYNDEDVKMFEKEPKCRQHRRRKPPGLPSSIKSIKTKHIDLLRKQQMFNLLQCETDLHDFTRLNNFTKEGDGLMSKIIQEHTRIQLKKEMLLTERELYVLAHKDGRPSDKNDDERKMLFSC